MNDAEESSMSTVLHLKKLVGESLVYGIAGVLTRFMSVFLVPIYTRIFAPSEYGVLGLVVTVAALLNILLILGLDNSMARWYYDTEDEVDRKTTLNTFLWSCVGVAALFAVLVAALRDVFAAEVIREPATAPLLLLMAANLPLAVFSVFTTNVLRMQRRAAATAVFTVVIALLNIGLNVLFVVVLRLGLSGIFYAQLLSSAVAAIWTFALFRKQIDPRHFSWPRWREMAAFSLPLVPGSIAFWVINLSGAYFIQLMNSTREAGLFYIGANVAGVLAIFTAAFQMAWGPFAYSIYRRSDAKQVYAEVLLAFLSVTCLISLGLMLFAPELLMIVATQDYEGAAWVAGLLAYNHVLIGVGYIASIGTGIAKNNRAYGAAMVVSAGLLIALNLVLVPRFGKEGAAVSILLAQGTVPLAIFIRAQKLYPIPYKFGKAIIIFVASLVFGFFGKAIVDSISPAPAASIGIKLSFLLISGALIFLIVRKEIGTTGALPDDAPAV
jgi:O-antigen/teichoic acid export membrane protein